MSLSAIRTSSRPQKACQVGPACQFHSPAPTGNQEVPRWPKAPVSKLRDLDGLVSFYCLQQINKLATKTACPKKTNVLSATPISDFNTRALNRSCCPHDWSRLAVCKGSDLPVDDSCGMLIQTCHQPLSLFWLMFLALFGWVSKSSMVLVASLQPSSLEGSR